MRKSLLLVAVLLLSACTTEPTASARTTLSASPGGGASGAVVYVAIGASETVGVGAHDRLRQAWPQIFFNIALPDSAVFYNYGFPGATTADAIQLELPPALAVHPTVVTIWLNVNDLIAEVPANTYEDQLRQIVGQLRAGSSSKILIANTPQLDRLPAYLACTTPSGSLRCPFHDPVPTAAQLDAMVIAYNAAVSRVAAAESATVVDLYSQGEVPDVHPEYLSGDGLHPNAAGYAAIARAFKVAFAAKTA